MRANIFFGTSLLFGIVACGSSYTNCSSCSDSPTTTVTSTVTTSCASPSCLGVGGITETASEVSSNTISGSASSTASGNSSDTTQYDHNLYEQDNWKVKLSTSFVQDTNPKGNIVLSALDSTRKVLVSLAKENFTGNQDQFLLASLRSAKESGAEVVQPKPTTVVVNNNKFSKLEVTQNNIKIFMWLTVKNNFAYILSCGGPQPHDRLSDICEPIISDVFVD